MHALEIVYVFTRSLTRERVYDDRERVRGLPRRTCVDVRADV